MKKWNGYKLKNDRLRDGDEFFFDEENRLLEVLRVGGAGSNLHWLGGGDNKLLLPFVSSIARFDELTRLLADAAGLECGKIEDVDGGWKRTFIRAKSARRR